MSSKAEIVLVTGASGYIASHVCSLLLKAGYHVRGTVRRIGSESSKHLTVENLVPDGKCPSKLTLVEADLLKSGSFDAHEAGCTYVIHMA